MVDQRACAGFKETGPANFKYCVVAAVAKVVTIGYRDIITRSQTGEPVIKIGVRIGVVVTEEQAADTVHKSGKLNVRQHGADIRFVPETDMVLQEQDVLLGAVYGEEGGIQLHGKIPQVTAYQDPPCIPGP